MKSPSENYPLDQKQAETLSKWGNKKPAAQPQRSEVKIGSKDCRIGTWNPMARDMIFRNPDAGAATSEPQEWTPGTVQKILDSGNGEQKLADAHNAALAAEREGKRNLAAVALEQEQELTAEQARNAALAASLAVIAHSPNVSEDIRQIALAHTKDKNAGAFLVKQLRDLRQELAAEREGKRNLATVALEQEQELAAEREGNDEACKQLEDYHRLVSFFRNEGYSKFGFYGDEHGLKPCETAIHFLSHEPAAQPQRKGENICFDPLCEIHKKHNAAQPQRRCRAALAKVKEGARCTCDTHKTCQIHNPLTDNVAKVNKCDNEYCPAVTIPCPLQQPADPYAEYCNDGPQP